MAAKLSGERQSPSATATLRSDPRRSVRVTGEFLPAGRGAHYHVSQSRSGPGAELPVVPGVAPEVGKHYVNGPASQSSDVAGLPGPTPFHGR